ncbi:MAG TPA: DUF2946 family protein [Stenotrophobium sp.]|nr:DUF2946 family protein [Stenotrophobium sp.]
MLLALVFNALSPLIAAAQMRQGGLQTLAMCTANGLQSVTLSSDGKVLPNAPAHTPCPFCLLSACGPALVASLPAIPAQAQPLHQSPVFIAQLPLRTGPSLSPPKRGPPILT